MITPALTLDIQLLSKPDPTGKRGNHRYIDFIRTSESGDLITIKTELSKLTLSSSSSILTKVINLESDKEIRIGFNDIIDFLEDIGEYRVI